MTAHLVIGGCVGEASLPVLIGAVMHKVGPPSLPQSILALVGVLWVTVAMMEATIWKKRREQEEQDGEGEREEEGKGGKKGGKEGGGEEVSVAGTEAGHLSLASWMTPGNPYLLPIGL